MGSAICGGVISDSKFQKDPMAYMMCFVMPDDKFKEYEVAVKNKDQKKRRELFSQYAMSVI